MPSFKTFSLAAILALLWSAAAHAQCAGGLIVNCPAAVNPQSTDVLQLWQLGQTPHMRKVTLGSATAGVSSFNTRTGNITLSLSDVTSALTFMPYNATNPSGYQTAANVASTLGAYAPLVSPNFTGTGTIPTPISTSNDTTIPNTSWVTSKITASTSGVSFVLGNSGSVTLSQLVTGGVAPLASPTFTGAPTLPTGTVAITQTLGNNTTAVATTAFDTAAVAVETSRATTAEALLLPKAGVTNGSNAAAGQIGEYVSSTVLVAGAVALTSGTPANVTSISLTAGDWDVWGNVGFNPGGATTYTALDGWIDTTSAASPVQPGNGAAFGIQAPLTAGQAQLFPTGMTRISISSTTTVYLGAFANFGTSTLSAFGFIGARRVR